MTAKKVSAGAVGIALSLNALLAAGQSLAPRGEAELKPLQGYWEGEGAGGKCYITITNNVLHYRNEREWFKTTFTLPDNTSPRQLHATIKATSGPTNSIGDVVHAIFKVEGDTLTLATIDPNEIPLKDFITAQDKYVVKKTAPPKGHSISDCKPTPRSAAGETNAFDSLFKFPISPGAK